MRLKGLIGRFALEGGGGYPPLLLHPWPGISVCRGAMGHAWLMDQL